jgi:hypothetical protein
MKNTGRKTYLEARLFHGQPGEPSGCVKPSRKRKKILTNGHTMPDASFKPVSLSSPSLSQLITLKPG